MTCIMCGSYQHKSGDCDVALPTHCPDCGSEEHLMHGIDWSQLDLTKGWRESKLRDWSFQMQFWGWAIVSTEPEPRDALRNPALVLESRDRFEPMAHAWDRKPEGQRVHGGVEVPVPDWWALHYVPPEWAEEALDRERAWDD